ncbi:flagellar basal body-associated FliL family protein [Parerythrobacter jejuensis]|uniref:Flagellar protein FliL n=1 Tax=Parerythrobacter jejuensis TaxID=795812 RepID=A0A845AMG1_9SPHN|nr:flagellar basal body-associated FliL family protein [Parerythrobacter jejuensis]MXP30617.1 flagellar basal body-associated protein FliL [Parerythrobacter jejuensis]MXP33377.1 flagellar basal body-associated protein FliL [Parerythrobacter jejuensis]
MSKPNSDETEPKPKGGKLKLVVGAILLLGAGAGGAYGAFAAGLIGEGHAEEGPDTPKLVTKGTEDPFAPAAGKGKDDQGEVIFGEGGSEYRTIYYSFEESFTSNLKNSAGLVQLSLAASTRHDGRVLQWLKRHELAVRSAILVVLASTPEEDVYSVEGKARLQARLTEAINTVLEEQEGFGGVDAVHFRTFLVQ